MRCAPDLFDHRLDAPVHSAQIGIAHFRAGHDHAQLVSLFQRAKIPAEVGRIVVVLLGKFFKRQNDAGLIELRNAAINELHAQRALAGAGRAFHQISGLAQKAAAQHLIQTGNAGFYPFHRFLLHCQATGLPA